MKKYLKFVVTIILLGNILQAGWDQSTQRWEADCNAGDSTACSFAAMSYAQGWLMIWDGKNNEEVESKKDYLTASILYKKGCKLGDKSACNEYKKFKNKIDKNYKISYRKNNIIYTILGKKKCSLYFSKTKRLQKHTCKKIFNSKRIKIYCSPLKKVCKTELEIKNAI